jgi:hypothetical protein
MTHSRSPGGPFRVRFSVATDVRLVHRHDAAELVKIRYNFAGEVRAICKQAFRSFTGAAGTSGYPGVDALSVAPLERGCADVMAP